MLDWQWPWLIVLLPLPLLLRRLLPAWQNQPAAIKVPFYTSLQAANHSQRPPILALDTVILSLLWIFLIAAACRPIWYGAPIDIATSGRDLMMAVDISDSMKIEDMQIENDYVTRIEAVKKVASEFVSARAGDRMGLILFGQRSYLMSPLTFDRNSVVVQLQEALPGFAGSSTAIGDAMGMAITLLRDRPSESRVLVLMTDGSNTYGSEPADATRVAVEADIRIHTIGVGGTRLHTVFADGRQMEIDPTRDLDEDALQTIAASTGGRYFRARDPLEMASIYQYINELEPVPEEKLLRPQRSLFHWPLAIALSCALLLLWRVKGVSHD
ncbi:MAG: VWA domain-containing protein [Granulosicoccus sp.]|nr:VWA domain-containing protein [Granulosicoccus sp.]